MAEIVEGTSSSVGALVGKTSAVIYYYNIIM